MNNRVLLLTDAMGSGGAERQLSYLAVGLKQAGCDVRLITFYPGENFYAADTAAVSIPTECWHQGKNKLRRVFTIRRLVKSWKPDMVICYKSGTCMAACLARMLTKFNLVVSERNTTQKLTFAEKAKFQLYHWADHIVPNSFSQSDFIARNYPKLMPKITVITNMVDTNRFSPTGDKPHNNVPKVVTVARVMPQKNVLAYLDAIKILKGMGISAHFDWYGNQTTMPEYWCQVKTRISDLGIEDMVTFHVPTKDTVAVYRSADIFLLPSLYEGFPNVLCEAMACGLPSIATGVCDSPRILNDSRFLPEPTPDSIAAAVKLMISLSQSEREAIGLRNRAMIEGLCAKNVFVKSYTSLI